MPAPPPPEELFSGLFARGEGAAQATDRALLQAMVDVELGLLRALAHAGLAPAHEAQPIDAASLNLRDLGESTAAKGTPVPALVAALRERVGDELAPYVHRGATSQDIVDTGLMLVARRSLHPILADLDAAADRCADLAEQHRATLQAGRTLLQHAVPVTFGLKAAGWLSALDQACARLSHVRERELAVQFGGAAGTLAALGDRGLQVAAELARELGIVAPDLPWHAIRLLPARLASELAAALGAMSKVARDVVLLAQTEVGELSAGGPAGQGGSSAMPHKRNPVGAVAVIACAQRAPGLAATILGSMAQEHERATGLWQAESQPLLELLRLTGSAAVALRGLLSGLEVDRRRMRANLELTRGLLMSESVTTLLAEPLGAVRAREVVEAAAERVLAEGGDLLDVLGGHDEVRGAVDPRELERALSPESYLGAADQLIERALAAHRRRERS